jgi:hypothetical protein
MSWNDDVNKCCTLIPLVDLPDNQGAPNIIFNMPMYCGTLILMLSLACQGLAWDFFLIFSWGFDIPYILFMLPSVMLRTSLVL